MALGTTKHPVGIQDNQKSANERNTIQFEVWHWNYHTGGSRTNKHSGQGLWRTEEPV